MAPINPPTWQQASTYSARLDRLIASGMMAPDPVAGALASRGGVKPHSSSTSLLVTQRASPGMAVTVAAGTAYVPASSAVGGMYTCHNDASFDVTISAAHATLGRRDLIVAQVRDAEYSGVNNDWLLTVVTGTPSGSPVLPGTPAGAVALAQVQVNANATSILNASITDLRQYTTAVGGVIPCPSTARPASPYKGMAIYDTSSNKPFWYNGSAWHSYSDEDYLTTSDLASYLTANGYVTSSYLTSNGYVTQAAVDAWSWSSYTPTWGASTANPTVGNGSIIGRYFKIGKLIVVRIGLDIGSTTGIGSGAYSFTLPFQPANFLTGGFLWGTGTGAINDSGTGQHIVIPYMVTISGTQKVRMFTSAGADVGHNVPMTWATGDDLDLTLAYQVA